MLIKVYNENGTVKVTKILKNGTEHVMFSDVQSGQVAEIEVIAETSYHAHLNEVIANN